jgi:hypothetical protein
MSILDPGNGEEVDPDQMGEPDDDRRRERYRQWIADHPEEAEGWDLGHDDPDGEGSEAS